MGYHQRHFSVSPLLLRYLLFLCLKKISMKLFHLVQNCYQTMGIYEPPQSNHLTIILRKLFFILSMMLMLFSNIGYFFYDANSISEYGNSFFTSNAQINTLIAYLISAWQMPNITKLIESYEKFIERSK